MKFIYKTFILLPILFFSTSIIAQQTQTACDIINAQPDTIYVEQCAPTVDQNVCLGISYYDFLTSSINVELDGIIYDGDFQGCDFQRKFSYPIYFISGINQGVSSRLVSWEINGIVIDSDAIFNSEEELVNIMDGIDPSGGWTLNNTIAESAALQNIGYYFYGTMEIERVGNPNINASLNANSVTIPNGTKITIPQNTQTLSLISVAESCTKDIILVTEGDASEPPSVTITDESCNGGDGSISYDNSNPNYSFEWSNGNIGSNIDSLLAGLYYVTITNNSCDQEWLDSFSILPSLSYDAEELQASCDGSGAAYVHYNNGNNYNVAWSNGEAGDTIQGVLPAWYSVTVTDPTGCQSHENVEVTEDYSCKVQISGYVFNDEPSVLDCDFDSDDLALGTKLVQLSSGTDTFLYYTSNASGYYEFIAYPDVYEIQILNPAAGTTDNCNPSGIINLNATTEGAIYENNNFSFEHPTDLNVYLLAGYVYPIGSAAVIGQERVLKAQIKNEGYGTAENIVLDLKHNEHLIFDNYIYPDTLSYNYDMNTRTISVDIPDFDVQDDAYIVEFHFQVTTDPNATGFASDSAWVNTSTQETFLDNNFDDYGYNIVTSYDPNDKIAITHPNDADVLIGTDKMSYQINFQNEGDFQAFDIVVKDELDLSVFDLRELEIMEASHDYELSFEGNNTLVFTFRNINLPTKDDDEEGSKGYVVFEIGLKNGLEEDEIIRNDAAIYFDYNPPIITNETANIIVGYPVGIQEEIVDVPVEVFPIPAKDEINVSVDWLSGESLDVEIYDTYGRLVLRNKISGNKEMNTILTKGIPTGNYTLKITDGTHFAIRKVMVLK